MQVGLSFALVHINFTCSSRTTLLLFNSTHNPTIPIQFYNNFTKSTTATMLVSPGCSTPTGIDTDDLGTPKLISISTPASHGLGSRVLRKYYASESAQLTKLSECALLTGLGDQERRAAARHSGKLEAIPLSPGSKSGRTKRKWSTVKVVIDENMAAAQAHAETHIDQALAFASLPASQKGPLPSRKKDTFVSSRGSPTHVLILLQIPCSRSDRI